MARIRSIKPEWLDDERLVYASDAARVLSVALILLADDYGNGRGRPEWLASRVFPAAKKSAATAALAELKRIGFVRLYAVRGENYYSLTNWSKHQRVDKPGRPLVPAPNESDGATPRNNSVPDSPANIPDSPANIPDSPATDLDLDLDQDRDQDLDHDRPASAMVPATDTFAEFWAAYPRKVGKPKAAEAWAKQGPPLAECLAALEWQRRSPQWVSDGGRFVPHPATWINRHGWQDEPPQAAATAFRSERDLRSDIAAAQFLATRGDNDRRG